MSNTLWERLGALSGIVFVVLLVISGGIAESNDDADLSPESPSAEIAREFVDQGGQDEVGVLVAFVGLIFFFWFLAYFRLQLQQSEGEGGWLHSVAYGGGLVGAGMLLVLGGLDLATTSVSNYGPDTEVAKALFALTWNSIWLIAPPLIALTAAASVVIIRFGALPKWVGWVGIVVAVSLFMPWIGIVGFMLWVLIVSVVLLIRAGRTAQVEPAS